MPTDLRGRLGSVNLDASQRNRRFLPPVVREAAETAEAILAVDAAMVAADFEGRFVTPGPTVAGLAPAGLTARDLPATPAPMLSDA